MQLRREGCRVGARRAYSEETSTRGFQRAERGWIVEPTTQDEFAGDCRTVHVRVRFEDQAYWATVDEYPGVFATGDTLDELRESLEEGISLVVVD